MFSCWVVVTQSCAVMRKLRVCYDSVGINIMENIENILDAFPAASNHTQLLLELFHR